MTLAILLKNYLKLHLYRKSIFTDKKKVFFLFFVVLRPLVVLSWGLGFGFWGLAWCLGEVGRGAVIGADALAPSAVVLHVVELVGLRVVVELLAEDLDPGEGISAIALVVRDREGRHGLLGGRLLGLGLGLGRLVLGVREQDASAGRLAGLLGLGLGLGLLLGADGGSGRGGLVLGGEGGVVLGVLLLQLRGELDLLVALDVRVLCNPGLVGLGLKPLRPADVLHVADPGIRRLLRLVLVRGVLRGSLLGGGLDLLGLGCSCTAQPGSDALANEFVSLGGGQRIEQCSDLERHLAVCVAACCGG